MDFSEIYGNEGFDTSGEGMDNFDPLPAGWYNAIAEDADVGPTRKEDGYLLKVKFAILDEPYNSRKVFQNLCIRHQNPDVENIANKSLTSFGRAVGVNNVKSNNDLLNKPLMIKIKVTNSEQYGPGNDVCGYKAIEGAAPQQQQQNVAGQPTVNANGQVPLQPPANAQTAVPVPPAPPPAAPIVNKTAGQTPLPWKR